MDQNPDKYFILHGRRTPIRDKDSTFLSNSQRTLSTRNLSQTTLYHTDVRNSILHNSPGDWTGHQSLAETKQSWRSPSPENPYAEVQENLRAKNSELSLDLRSLNSSLNKSLSKSVSFSDKKTNAQKKQRDDDELSLEDTFEEELQRLIDADTLELEEMEQNFAGKSQRKTKSQWYVEPVHLTRDSDYPVFSSLGAKEHTVSLVNRTTGVLGTEMAQRKVASNIMLDDEAKQYFPVTLGEVPAIMETLTMAPPLETAAQAVRDRTSRSVMSDVGPRKTAAGIKTGSTSRKPASASGRLRTSQRRMQESQTLQDPQMKATRDYSYLKASQQFVDQKVVASPFEYELAKLRMERLRLEEQRILETKRQDELERIRGPTPKWYELKTPKFTYEHAKNNQLINSKKEWQALYDYRTELLSASHEFTKSAT
ncbi:uncharacterized protein [Diadema antillarum]|uniref:uncharacterized protein n=1 Tax=Diadema antillarum TaxID=105358 RepID=UPI003A8A6966